MTNYLIPETDRIANDVNPILSDIADMDETMGKAVQIGALTVIGLLGESLADLLDVTIAQAATQGVSRKEAEATFDVVFRDGLFGILQPRIDRLRDATLKAQGIPSPTEGVDVLIAGLLANLIGEEAAAEFLASIAEADEEDEGDDYYDAWDDYEDYEDDEFYTDTVAVEEENAKEFTQFLNDLFNAPTPRTNSIFV